MKFSWPHLIFLEVFLKIVPLNFYRLLLHGYPNNMYDSILLLEQKKCLDENVISKFSWKCGRNFIISYHKMPRLILYGTDLIPLLTFSDFIYFLIKKIYIYILRIYSQFMVLNTATANPPALYFVDCIYFTLEIQKFFSVSYIWQSVEVYFKLFERNVCQFIILWNVYFVQ